MKLSKWSSPYIIPEYSLTGDLLSYLNCGLQYRYHNKGSLPPSTPVQLWSGEFIHSVMEEAYYDWNENRVGFPWEWNPHIRNIELKIAERLNAKGLSSPSWLFCPFSSSTKKKGYCQDENHPHKLIASERAEAAINTWGKHLFPLIDEAEVKLKGIRDMPNYHPSVSRSNYYGITGIIDVISSVCLQNAPSGNLILHYIHNNPSLRNEIDNLSSPQYEIIIDYKGMRRPAINDPAWKYHEWQILTYAWLRRQQPEARHIVAGILFYFDELKYSREGMSDFQSDVELENTDILPRGLDLKSIRDWKKERPVPKLSNLLKEQRSIRIVPIGKSPISESLSEFDKLVSEIETNVLSEMLGGKIISSWPVNPKERTCTACDFKTFCPDPAPKRYSPTVP